MSSSIDSLDIKVLQALSSNARKAYLEIARETGVSGAAIHQRVGKLIQAGIITGSETLIAPSTIGLNTMAFVGVIVQDSLKFNEIIEKLNDIPEITEAYFTTGQYDLILKVYARNNEDLLDIIQTKIQSLESVRTITNIALKEAIRRQPPINPANIPG